MVKALCSGEDRSEKSRGFESHSIQYFFSFFFFFSPRLPFFSFVVALFDTRKRVSIQHPGMGELYPGTGEQSLRNTMWSGVSHLGHSASSIWPT